MIDWESFEPKAERERAGMTQADMAAMFGVDPSQISRWEKDPDGMTRSQLKRWADACGYFRSPAGLDIGDVYADLRERLSATIAYVDRWFDYEEAADDVPAPRVIVQALKNLRYKPVGALAGAPDSGKSRLANTLYGSDILPVGFGPATRLLCLCRHVNDRPPEMDALVYVLDDGFDLARASDVEHVREHRLLSGGYEVLKQVGVHDYQKERGGLHALRRLSDEARSNEKGADRGGEAGPERYALIYIDNPLLLATDLLDPPGLSEDPVDVKLAWEAISRASYIIHCSPIAGYMGATDLQILQEAVQHLPELPEKSENPFANLLLVCSHAATHIGDLDVDQARYIGATRLQQHLAKAVPNVMLKRCFGTSVANAAQQRDALFERTVPFFVESEARRSATLAAVDRMLTSCVRRQHSVVLAADTARVMNRFRNAYARRLERIERLIFEIECGLREFRSTKQEREARASSMNQKKNKLDEIFYEAAQSSEEDAGRIADAYLDHLFVKKIIDEHYGNNREEAKAGLGALITSFIQDEVTSVLRKRLPAVEEAVRDIAEFHSRHLDRFEPELKIGSISDVDLNTVLTVAGGVGATSVGALTLAGALLPIAPFVAIGIFIGGVISAARGLLRSWQEKLARSAAEDLASINLKGILKAAVRAHWLELRQRIDGAIDAMERQYAERLRYLEDLARSGPEEQLERLGAEAHRARRTLAYLEAAPLDWNPEC
jgi:transcriptional regulator with XRE-family HTH domain